MCVKHCFVPDCWNDSISTPMKLFATVPTNMVPRHIWFAVAQRRCPEVDPDQPYFCCEDHFNLSEDRDGVHNRRENGNCLILKPGTFPHIYPNNQQRSSIQNTTGEKRKRIIELIQEGTFATSDQQIFVPPKIQKKDAFTEIEKQRLCVCNCSCGANEQNLTNPKNRTDKAVQVSTLQEKIKDVIGKKDATYEASLNTADANVP